MSKRKPTPGGRSKKPPSASLVRSSAAEYLTFVAASGSSEASIEMRYEDENIWLTQKMMAALYDVSVPAINQHLKRIFSDNELDESSVVKQYLTTAAKGKGYRPEHSSPTTFFKDARSDSCRAKPGIGANGRLPIKPITT